MKLLTFSDLHRDVAAARAIIDQSRDADLVVGAGDFATMGQGHADTLDVLREIAVPFVFVAGNHDRLDDLRTACEDWANAHLLHGESVMISGLVVFGLGFEISTVDRGPWNSQMSEADAARQLAPCPSHALLVTHAPPHGAADIQRTGEHEGSTAIRDAISVKSPRLAICGHIHHAWGTSGLIGATPVHNIGPSPMWFTV